MLNAASILSLPTGSSMMIVGFHQKCAVPWSVLSPQRMRHGIRLVGGALIALTGLEEAANAICR
jgi:hypothetical protein